MELTQEMVDRFVGGQLEVQNRNEGYLYRGEISAIRVEGAGERAELQVDFAWFAQMGEDAKWTLSTTEEYLASMLIYSASDIGDGRLCLSSWLTGETTVLFPPDGSKLDPAKVRGLVLNKS